MEPFRLRQIFPVLQLAIISFNIRTKDNLGRWSLTTRNNVEVFTPDAKVSIVSGEYFIDADPGYGNANAINSYRT